MIALDHQAGDELGIEAADATLAAGLTAQEALQAWMLGRLAEDCLRMGRLPEAERTIRFLDVFGDTATAPVARLIGRQRIARYAALAVAKELTKATPAPTLA